MIQKLMQNIETFQINLEKKRMQYARVWNEGISIISFGSPQRTQLVFYQN